MKRIMLIIFCIFWFVLPIYAQKITKYRYFINDYKKEVTVNKKVLNDSINVKMVGPLSFGIHTFGIQFLDDKGVWSPLQQQNFIYQPPNITGNTYKAVEYWFNNNSKNKKHITLNAANGINFNKLIPVPKELPNGMNSFYIRVLNKKQQWSSIMNHNFLKTPKATSKNGLVAFEYWFNNVDKKVSIPLKNGVLNTNYFIAVNPKLPEGLHTFYAQVKDNVGNYTALQSHNFINIPKQISKNKLVSLEYWFNNVSNKVTIPLKNGKLKENYFFEIKNNLPEGLHTFYAQVKDNRGNYTALQAQNFLKLPKKKDGEKAVTIAYWFNDEEDKKVTIPLKNGVVNSNHLIAVPEELPDGVHTFNAKVKDAYSNWSPLQSQSFIKVKSVKNNTIISYKYWFDNFENDVVQIDKLNLKSNIFELDNNILVPTKLPEGKRNINYQFKDKAGNWSGVVSKEVFIGYYLPEKVKVANLNDDLNKQDVKIYPGGTVHRYYKITDAATNKPVRGAHIYYKIDGKELKSAPSTTEGYVNLNMKLGGENPLSKDDDIVPDVRKKYNVTLTKVSSLKGDKTTEISYQNVDETFDLLMKSFDQVEKSQGVYFQAGMTLSVSKKRRYGLHQMGFAKKEPIIVNSRSYGLGAKAKLDIVFERNDITDKIDALKIGLTFTGNMAYSGKEIIAKLNANLNDTNVSFSASSSFGSGAKVKAGAKIDFVIQRVSDKHKIKLQFLQLFLNLYNLVNKDNIITYNLAEYINAYLKDEDYLLRVSRLGSFYGFDSSINQSNNYGVSFDLANKGIRYTKADVTNFVPSKKEAGISYQSKLTDGEGGLYNYNFRYSNIFRLTDVSRGMTFYRKSSDVNFINLDLDYKKKFSLSSYSISFPLVEMINNKKEKSFSIVQNFDVENNYEETGVLSVSTENNAEDTNFLGRTFNKKVTRTLNLGKNALASFVNDNTTMSVFNTEDNVVLDIDTAVSDMVNIKNKVFNNEVTTDNWTINDFQHSRTDTYTKGYDYEFDINILDAGIKLLNFGSASFNTKVSKSFAFGVEWDAEYPLQKSIYLPSIKRFVPVYENIGANNLDVYIENPAESEVVELLNEGFDYVKNKFNEIVSAFTNTLIEGAEIIVNSVRKFSNKLFSRKVTGVINGTKTYTQKEIARTNENSSSSFVFYYNDDGTTFNSQTNVSLKHLFSNGELEGKIKKTNVQDEYEKFLIISDLMFFKAEKGGQIITESLKKFLIDVKVGKNDLTYFGVDENASIELFYSSDSKTKWESLGVVTKETSTFKSRKLGIYALGVRLKPDDIKPTITVVKNQEQRTLTYTISDNSSGINWSTLHAEINGVATAFTKKNNEITIVLPRTNTGINQINLWVKDNYGNLNESVEVLDLTLGTNEAEKITSINFYPNPVPNYLNINSPVIISKIAIFDTTGKVIFNKVINSTEAKLDLQGYAKGIYFVKIWSDKKVKSISIIKQ